MNFSIFYSPDVDALAIRKVASRLGIPAYEITPESIQSTDFKVLVGTPSYFAANKNSDLNGLAGFFVVTTDGLDLHSLKFSQTIPMDHSTHEIDERRLQNLVEHARLKHQIASMRKERDVYLHRIRECNNIGIALSTEKDPVRLLNMILQKSREITSADAGSLYLVEGDEETGKHLRVKLSQNDSIPIDYREYVIPITKNSIAGYVAITGRPINIADVYDAKSSQQYNFNREFDQKTGYRTVSMLSVPMQNYQGNTIGIIQLINRKKDFSTKLIPDNYAQVIDTFTEEDEDLVSSLASQAAVALENNNLLKNIQQLFEGFVTASVTAIESRDPTTSGHSFRVANLTVGLATLVDRQENGKFRDIRFKPEEIKEIRYAALLHDFGKVGVRENVLVKAKKLYPMQMDLIRQRFEYLKKCWELDFFKSQFSLLLTQGRESFEVQNHLLEQTYQHRLDSLDDYWTFIVQSNEPSVLPEGNFDRLLRIASEQELLPPGSEGPLLTPEEVHLLCIRRGNLNDRERMEIESHVTHTFLFLSKIPWTPELRDVPKIAYGHHEKLDGTGYPNRLRGPEIPVQTRMMTISDIYDALTASDRPYKRAVATQRALDILSAEVKAQQLDPDLFQLFLEAKVYQLATGKK